MKKLSVFIILAGCAFILSACGGAVERKAEHVRAGDKYYAAENYEKARLEFKNALRIDPKDPEVHFKMGLIYERLNNYKAAAGEYIGVIQLDATNIEARVNLGKLYLLGRAAELAGGIIDEIRRIDPENNDQLFLQAGLDLLKQDTDSALKNAQQAFERDPDNQDIASLLASIYTRRNEIPKAIEILEGSLQRRSGSIAIRMVLAQLYDQVGDLDSALKVLRENHELQPTDVGHLVRMTSAYMAAGRHAEAEQMLRKTVTEQPENIPAKLILGDFLLGRNGFEIAERELQSFIDAQPAEQELKFGLARMYESTGSMEKAAAVYRTISQQEGVHPEGLRAKTAMARALFGQGKPSEAGQLLAEVLQHNAYDRGALMLRATYNMQQADYATAIADLRSILKDNAEDVEVLKFLARAHMANKEQDLAEDNFGKVLQANPADMEARLALAELQTMAGNLDRAEENYRLILKIIPNSREAHSGLIRALLSADNQRAAEAALANFKSLNKEDALVHYFTGTLQARDRRYAESIGSFKKALELRPDAIEPLAGLINSYVLLKQDAEAILYLQNHIKSQPGSVFAKNLTGELLLKKGDMEKSIAILREAIDQQPDFWMPYRNLAVAYTRQNRRDLAVEAYSKGIAATGHDERLVIELALLYESQGEHEKSLQQYHSAIEQGLRSDAIENNLAMALVTYKENEENLLKARKLVEKFRESKNPAFLDTYGWVNLRAGQYQEALSALQLALKRAPESPLISYHLAEAYYRTDQAELAVKYLEQALQKEDTRFTGKEQAESLLSELKSKSS